MDTNTFKPSIDWGYELFNSARWILEAFAVTASCWWSSSWSRD
jgi:hypothetical protein